MVRTNTVEGPRVAVMRGHSYQGLATGPGDGARWQWALVLSRPQAWRDARRGRGSPARSLAWVRLRRPDECLNFGNPENRKSCGSFRRRLTNYEGLRRAGNSELLAQRQPLQRTLGEGIYPTPVLGVVGFLRMSRRPQGCISRTGTHLILLRGPNRRCQPTRDRSRVSEYAKEISTRSGDSARAGVGKRSCPHPSS